MSGGDEYHWRETYFILFDRRRRPTLTQVERELGELNAKYQLLDLEADDDGLFDSLRLRAPDDRAMLEITFESGEAVVEQSRELNSRLADEAEPEQLAVLREADARLDIMHFEQISEEAYPAGDTLDEMLDPSCLLMVVDTLVALTDGLAIDPASGAILP
jgi:hypothetical protein